MRRSPLPLALGTLLAVAGTAQAQGYRLRLDSRVQAASYRGVALDSIPASQAVIGPSGGFETPDGFAVECTTGSAWCYYYRAGPERSAAPAVTSADLTLWGVGLTGVSLHASARAAFDLGDADVWPGTDPSVQVLEAYAEYAGRRLTLRGGRQTYVSRLGYTGFDGGRILYRGPFTGVQVGGYLGWGLARGTAIPINSPALNPLDDYQPRKRQVVAGLEAGWQSAWGDLRAEYQREVDPRSDYFVSERASVSAVLRPFGPVSLAGGADYDLARGYWGTVDASLRYLSQAVAATAGIRRYRPHFDLWTIWGSFSPVGHTAVNGSVAYSPEANVQFRARGERYWFEEDEADTPLAGAEDRGWRFALGATWTPWPALTLDLGHQGEFGVGGSSSGYDATVSWRPTGTLDLSLTGAKITRPLEFRFNEANLRLLGFEGSWRPSAQWAVAVGASRYLEERRRPDAAGFDWDQTRLHARISFFLGSGADRLSLPPGRPRASRSAPSAGEESR